MKYRIIGMPLGLTSTGYQVQIEKSFLGFTYWKNIGRPHLYFRIAKEQVRRYARLGNVVEEGYIYSCKECCK